MPSDDVHIDPTEVRAIADEMYTEITTEIEPRLLAAVAKIQGGDQTGLNADGPPIGGSDADYAGTVMGQKLTANAADIADWIKEYVKSVKEYATGLAVVSESLVEADEAAARETATAFNGPAEWDQHGNPTKYGWTGDGNGR